MKKYLYEIVKIILIVLASFIGAAAIWGGIHLIIDPTGQKINLHEHLSKVSFANDYLVLGIILISVIALSQIISVILLLLNNNYVAIYVAGAGLLLLIWTSVQLIFIGWILYSILYFALSIIEIGLAIWFFFIVKHRLKKMKKK